MVKKITLTLEEIEDIIIDHIKKSITSSAVDIEWRLRGKNTILTITENNSHTVM